MSSDPEEEEARRLEREINHTISRINSLVDENARLERELDSAIVNLQAVTSNLVTMCRQSFSHMSLLSNEVTKADLDVQETFAAINNLSDKYFNYKNISMASKELSRATDEYHTRFFFFNKLRRITLGYIIGVDAQIISSQSLRKQVEDIYLQNTEYWLAYAIAAVMLWCSDERDAANRALARSLLMERHHACLFYLLVNLRFNRSAAARKWYMAYLENSDTASPGPECQYLLQAYFHGAFGQDEELGRKVAEGYKKMYERFREAEPGFRERAKEHARRFAERLPHGTRNDYALLKYHCEAYGELEELLSSAEKNALLAAYFNELRERPADKAEELPQRIENILYSLISDYEAAELLVIKKMRYNEAIINSNGDLAQAKEFLNMLFPVSKANFGDLLLKWAFSSQVDAVDVSIRKFAIVLLKRELRDGMSAYAEGYRSRCPEEVTLKFEDCELLCGKKTAEESRQELIRFYKGKRAGLLASDSWMRAGWGVVLAGVIMLLLLFRFRNPILLAAGVFTCVIGSFIVWRRTIRILQRHHEHTQKVADRLMKTLEVFAQWRNDYRVADADLEGLLKVIEDI